MPKTWIILFLLLILAPVGWILRGYFKQKLMDIPPKAEWGKKVFQVIAHRGASGYAPENTLSAIKKAMEMEVDMIEIDIHLSKDGEVIVIHDATLERTTNGTGKVEESTWKELQKLDAGSWYSDEFKGESIPSLKDVLELVDGKAKILIEIKVNADARLYEGLITSTLSLIVEKQAENWCIIQTFDSRYLKEVAQSGVNIEFQKLIFDDYSPLPAYSDTGFKFGNLDKTIGFTAINSYFALLSKGKVEATQQEGFKVFTYTVNEIDDLKKIASFGVDGIITNYPDRALKIKNGELE